MNHVFPDTVHHDLHRLRVVFRVNPDGLVQIHFLFVQLVVVHDHRQIIILVLCVRSAQRKRDRAEPLELLRFVQIKFKVTALSLFLQRHQFVMCLRDCAVEFVLG